MDHPQSPIREGSGVSLNVSPIHLGRRRSREVDNDRSMDNVEADHQAKKKLYKKKDSGSMSASAPGLGIYSDSMSPSAAPLEESIDDCPPGEDPQPEMAHPEKFLLQGEAAEGNRVGDPDLAALAEVVADGFERVCATMLRIADRRNRFEAHLYKMRLEDDTKRMKLRLEEETKRMELHCKLHLQLVEILAQRRD